MTVYSIQRVPAVGTQLGADTVNAGYLLRVACSVGRPRCVISSEMLLRESGARRDADRDHPSGQARSGFMLT